jgi:phosphoribosylformimino-5-aminoimidazole carboxamide ribotide isomerase
MLLIPAIDLKDGCCVRLRQGRMDDETRFSDNPVEMAERWRQAGARRLHLVDLNGAFAGEPVNGKAIQAIAQACPNLPIQVGGGIRDLKTIGAYLDAGVDYCIIGTQAVIEPAFVARACETFPGRILVGLDAKDGQVAIRGWAETTAHRVEELARRFASDGIEGVIYTDIGRDGMLSGPNLAATRALAEAIKVPVIASGGITSLEDVRALAELAAGLVTGLAQGGIGDGIGGSISGAITGRAIYEGTLDFAAGQRLADSLSTSG